MMSDGCIDDDYDGDDGFIGDDGDDDDSLVHGFFLI